MFTSGIILQMEILMTTGIYQLSFNDQAFYIGQAQDIGARWRQHTDKFRKGAAAQKMQAAYDKYGMPDFKVILECHKDYLDIMEPYYININKQYMGCLNTSIPKLDPEVDYEQLLSRNLMQHSAVSMMETALLYAEENSELKQQQSYQYAKAVLAEGKDKNEQLVKDYLERLQRAQDTLNRLNHRGLLQRIFNYD